MDVRKVVWLIFPRGHAASGDSMKLFFCIEGKQCVVLVRMEGSRRVKTPWTRKEEMADFDSIRKQCFTTILYLICMITGYLEICCIIEQQSMFCVICMG